MSIYVAGAGVSLLSFCIRKKLRLKTPRFSGSATENRSRFPDPFRLFNSRLDGNSIVHHGVMDDTVS